VPFGLENGISDIPSKLSFSIFIKQLLFKLFKLLHLNLLQFLLPTLCSNAQNAQNVEQPCKISRLKRGKLSKTYAFNIEKDRKANDP
jgi:hypothetical protein